MADLLSSADLAKAILDDVAAFEAGIQAKMAANVKMLEDLAARNEALTRELMAPAGSASPALG